MGTPIGFFADDTPQDYPELNKCPDCETYFQTPCCPLCGKECPETCGQATARRSGSSVPGAGAETGACGSSRGI